TGTERRRHALARGHCHLTRGEDEERHPGCSLADQTRVGPDVPGIEQAGDILELVRAERPEERYRLEVARTGGGHLANLQAGPSWPVGWNAARWVIDDAVGVEQALVAVPNEARIARRERLRHVTRSKPLLIGGAIVAFWVFWTIAGARLTPQNPYAISDHILASPSGTHWFGTD